MKAKTKVKVGVIIIGFLLLGACAQNSKAYDDEIVLEAADEGIAWAEDQIEATEQEEIYEEQKDKNLYDDSNSDVSGFTEVSSSKDNYTTTKQSNKQTINQNKESVLSSKGISNPYRDKKFIKQADIRFLVEDVYESTVAIENILIENDGFLLNSNIQAEILNEQEFEKDNTWNTRVQEYVNTNYITFRVPNQNLHATLMALGKEIVFLNERSISVEDVGLKLLAESLEQKRNAKSKAAIQNDINNGGKLDDKIYAQEVAFNRQKEQDISYIEQLNMEDKVEFSTITVHIYEDEKVFVSDVPNIQGYKNTLKKPYYKELAVSLQYGIDVLKIIGRILVSLLPIALISLLVFLGLKRFVFKK